ncbi:glycoside hydrolase family 43 protein [Sphingobacterium sp. LRF_L2]|uniref:glycoside hydrolase family 43 protein n=1 Tax=Sphingobacterium sp. LRF_L2 TaxID=3369421 RepID=UPI003F5DCB56
MKKRYVPVILGLLTVVFNFPLFGQAQYLSEVWSPDLGNGNYKNPIIYADYSDPDVCRVGDDFYMTASSFNAVPGLPILHSKDMVNWEIINYAIPRLQAEAGIPLKFFDRPQHGNGVWAPAIRFHNGDFYIFYGDPDFGIYMTKTKDPRGEWEPLALVKSGKGLIDACPFWDKDGKAYLVHAYAGSRAGIKSVLAITELSADGKKAIGTSKIIYDGHDVDPTIEGPKFYKRNGYYYIFAPAGGVATGWQTVLRSKSIFGPYERKVVLEQKDTEVNGPHQGAWVDSPKGEDWFFHFQDVGTVGRIVHLQPMRWKNDWPVIGEDADNTGIGKPVSTYKKPLHVSERINPVETDEFNENNLGLQWQWHANPHDWWYFSDAAKGVLRLFSVQVPENYKNLWDVPNLMLQKMPAADFIATTKVNFRPDSKLMAERTGLVVMGLDYGLLSLQFDERGFTLAQIECVNAERQKPETIVERVNLTNGEVYLRVQVSKGKDCLFLYSIDGVNFERLGKSFSAKEGKWIGAKIGIFSCRLKASNDGGYADFDWFRITRD